MSLLKSTFIGYKWLDNVGHFQQRSPQFVLVFKISRIRVYFHFCELEQAKMCLKHGCVEAFLGKALPEKLKE